MPITKLEKRGYSDWFGHGDVVQDIKSAIEKYGEPKKIFIQQDGFMAALTYNDKIIVVGYDGNEYCHIFEMTERIVV